MLAPTIIAVPEGTKAFYITCLSLCPTTSTCGVNWHYEPGSATFGAKFAGPDPNVILGDTVFGQPIIALEGGEMPKELSVFFNFQDTMTTQHSVAEPLTASCGPAGSASKVIISAYAAGDIDKSFPMRLTIMFEKKMKGVVTGKHHEHLIKEAQVV